MNRRHFLIGAPLALGGCVSASIEPPVPGIGSAHYRSMYASIDSEPFPVPAVNLKKIVDPKFLRREVAYETDRAAGTIVVDPNERFAYFVLGGGRAIRYGVGVGKVETFNFQGEATIARKAEWPGWIPTQSMIARNPEKYGPLRDGLPGGPRNPLGPRALYLYRGGRDTYYRLHGTIEPWTIGTKVSSGCIRLLNQDIMDLYDRVPVGSRAVVLPIRGEMAA